MEAILITAALVVAFLAIFCISPIYGIAFVTAFRTLSLLAEVHADNADYGYSAEGFLTLAIICAGLIYFTANCRDLKGVLKWPFVIFILYCFLTMVGAADAANFLKKFARLVGYFSLYLMVVHLCRKKENTAILSYAFLVSLLVTTLPAFFIYCQDPDRQMKVLMGTAPGVQQVGFMMKNNFGFYSCYMVFFLIYLYSAAKKYLLKSLFLVLLLLQAAMLVLSYTRSAWAAFLMAFAMLAVCSRKKARLLLPFLAMILIGASLYSVVYYGAYQDLTEKKQYGFSSWHYRTAYAWPASIKAFKERPLMGWGLGNDMYALAHAANFNNSSHNDYLLVLVETGCIGLSLYLVLLLSLLRKTLASIRLATDEESRLLAVSALAILVAYLVGSAAEHLLQTPGATGYVITVLGMAHGSLLTRPRELPAAATLARLGRVFPAGAVALPALGSKNLL